MRQNPVLHSSFSRKSTWVLALACSLYLVLAAGLAVTNLPLIDEAFYGIPAYFLSTQGQLRNPVLESAGISYLTGINRILYWMAPGAMLLQAAAFKLFGFSLMVQRALSVTCGLGALLGWFFAIRKLLGVNVASLACLILSFDFLFCSLSSRGRADIISLFFGILGLALYLNLRERSLSWALALGNAGCALSGLIHPNGGVTAVASLAITILYLDRRRLHTKEICLAALPYLLGALAWSGYIAKDPSLWIAQFLGNVRYRNAAPFTLTSALSGEVQRYLYAYNVGGLHDPRILRALLPLSYWSVALICATRLRKRVPQLPWLLLVLGGQLLSYLLFERSKVGWYALYIVPTLCTLTAVWLVYLRNRRTTLSLFVAAIQLLLLLISVVSSASNIWRRNYQHQYLPLTAFLNARVQPGELVFGRTDLYYNLHCRSCLRDDLELGAISGRRAAVIVIDLDYRESFRKFASQDQPVYRHIQNLLGTGYRPVYENSAYEVLVRRPG